MFHAIPRPRLPRGRPARPLLALVFALASLPVLLVFALVVPAGEIPDEVAHIMRADSVRHLQIAGVRRPRLDDQGNPATDVVVGGDPSLLGAGFAFSPGLPLARKAVTQARLDALYGMVWANRLEAISIPNTAVYPPTLYLPAAIAMHAAKLAGSGPYTAILAARLMNAALFLVLGAAALLLATRGRTILLATLCLPMSLFLAASVNQDGLVIALGGLAAALLTRPGPRAWWAGAAVFAVAAMAKPYLLPLVLILPACMPGTLRRNPGRALGGLAVAAGPAVLWGAAMAAFVAAPFVRGPAQAAGPLYAGTPGTLFATTNPGEQLRILLAAPTRLLTMPLESAWAKGEWLWREGIGVLGTLDVILPPSLYIAWPWALGAALLAGCMANPLRRDGGRVLPTLAALLGLIASAWLAYLLQYLSWTRVGEALIDGIQGRYFIPAAAIALPIAAFVEDDRRDAKALRALLSLPVVLLCLAQAAILPAVVLQAYYIR